MLTLVMMVYFQKSSSIVMEADHEADAVVAPRRCGFWSSKNFKLIAGLTLLSALICVFAASGRSIKEYHMRRSDAANLQTTYPDYGAATASQKSKSSKKCKSPKCPKAPKSPKAPKTRNLKSKKGNTPASSTTPPTTCAPTAEKKSKGSEDFSSGRTSDQSSSDHSLDHSRALTVTEPSLDDGGCLDR